MPALPREPAADEANALFARLRAAVVEVGVVDQERLRPTPWPAGPWPPAAPPGGGRRSPYPSVAKARVWRAARARWSHSRRWAYQVRWSSPMRNW